MTLMRILYVTSQNVCHKEGLSAQRSVFITGGVQGSRSYQLMLW